VLILVFAQENLIPEWKHINFQFENIFFLLKMLQKKKKFNIFICSYRFASKMLMFQETLQFWETKIKCYEAINRMRLPLTWNITQIIVDYITYVVFACVFDNCKVISC
jgi:hypothetical protein